MKHTPFIPIILTPILLFSFDLAAQQKNHEPDGRITNAEPIHAHYALEDDRTIPITLKKQDSAKAIYHQGFQYQSGWKGKQVMVRLDEITEPFSLKINGFHYGSGNGQRICVEFNITPFLKLELNLLELEFDQAPDRLLENCMGTLLVREPVHIRDIQVNSYFQTGSSNILVRVHLYIQSFLTEKNRGRTLTMKISDPDKETIITKKQVLDFPLAFRQEVEFTFDQTIEDPLLWSPDHPYLYTVQLALMENGQKQQDLISTTFGMRNASFTDSILVINHDTIIPKIVDQQLLIHQFMQSDEEVLNLFNERG